MMKLQNLRAGYDGRDVLHDLSLTAEAGKITVLIGPNGCGKSTLLKTVVGIVPSTAGSMEVSGVSADSLSPKQLARQVSYLPQTRRTPDISVLRMVLHGRFPYLSYPRRYRSEDMNIARQALRRMGLEDLENESVSRLSGGMQQKVCIAMALAQDTPVILMDEPTTFLDIGHQLQTLEIIRALADEGKTVLAVLHDLPQALRVADAVAVMADGRIVRCGTPDEIAADPITEQVFGVRLRSVSTPDGRQYFCVPAEV